MLIDRQIREKRLDLGRAKRLWMPFLVKKDEPTNPADVGFFSAQSVVLKTQSVTDAVKQAR